LVGALKNGMGMCGARTIKEMHRCQIVLAPTINTEGKRLQREQGVGQGR
jgi:IMP dehydrogenase